MALHKDVSVPLSQLFGGWSPSRAINRSEGDDPISLGMFSHALAPAPAGTAPDPPPAMEAPAPPGPMNAVAVPSPDPRPELLVNVIELDLGRVHLNGRTFPLSAQTKQAILEAVLYDYELALFHEVTALRSALLEKESHEVGAMQPPDQQPAVVPDVQGTAAPQQPEEQGTTSTTNMQPVPSAKRAARRVRSVLRTATGEGATNPSP